MRRWGKGRVFIEPERFRRIRNTSSLTQEDVADHLGVTVRTVKNWERGAVLIPYAAFRLLRVLSGYKLPGAPWRGYTLRGDTLWTPEGKPLYAWEMKWLSLVFGMARYWLRDHGHNPADLPAKQLLERLRPLQGRVRRRTAPLVVDRPLPDRGLPGPLPRFNSGVLGLGAFEVVGVEGLGGAERRPSPTPLTCITDT